MSKPIEIQSVKQWNEIIEAANDKTLVVDFHATWCGPCKVIAPQFSQLAEQNPNVQFLRVDVDEHAAIAEFFQVRAMPTFYAIKNREVVGWLRGADPKGLANLVKEHGATPAPESQIEESAPSSNL